MRKSYNKHNVHKLANTLLRTSLGSVCRALTCRGVILLLFQWSESFRWGIASRWRTCVWNSRAKLHCGNHWAHHSQCTVSERALLGHIRGSSVQMLLSHTSYIIGYSSDRPLSYMLDSMRFYFSRSILFDEMRKPRAFYLSSLYTLNTHLCAYPLVCSGLVA